MQAISALAFIPFGSYRRTNLCLQNFEGLQFPSYAITWHGIMHACRHINELYACQVSDGYLVKQASSSGSNFSRFWQLMDEKFGPKVTSIFRAETSAKRYTWDKQSISHMHLRFSFFRIWAITIRSREITYFRDYALVWLNKKKRRISGIFSQWIYRKYLLIQHSFRPIRESHFYTLISIGCLYKILWPFITLYSNNLLR